MITFLDILSTNPSYEYISTNQQLINNLSPQDIPLYNEYTKYLSQDPTLSLSQIFPQLQSPEYQQYSDIPTHDIVAQYIAEQINYHISLQLTNLSQQVRTQRSNPTYIRPNLTNTTISNNTRYI